MNSDHLKRYQRERELALALKKELQHLTIRTHVPDKWRFVDLETGDCWRYDQATKQMVGAHDVVVHLDVNHRCQFPEHDPRWPAFMSWVNSLSCKWNRRDLALWWDGYSAGHPLVAKQDGEQPLGTVYVLKDAPAPQEYIRPMDVNQYGDPVRSAATTTSLAFKMTELIGRLRREGFADLRWPDIIQQSYDKWGDDYATCMHAYPDDVDLGDYFDREAYYVRFE